MAGSVTGGKKAAATNKAKYGEDWYRKIGQKGGKSSTWKPKGFGANRELAREAGRKGGLKSKRGKKMPDNLYQLRQKMYQAHARANHYKRLLTTAVYDLHIQQAEKMLEYWEKISRDLEKQVEEEEKK